MEPHVKPTAIPTLDRTIRRFALVTDFSCGAATPPPEPGQQPPPPPAQPLSAQQLDDLVAPVALYPDNILSQILAASTYPLEIVEAQQWLMQNQKLQGKALLDAAKHQNWDPSIQALVVFPDVLMRLNSDIRWTTDLGNAFLSQQADVMGAIQRMRGRAQMNGKLQSDAARERHHANSERSNRDSDRAHESGCSLRAGVQSAMGVGPAGVGRLSSRLVSGDRCRVQLFPGHLHRWFLWWLGRLGLGRLGLGLRLVRRRHYREQLVLPSFRFPRFPRARFAGKLGVGPQSRASNRSALSQS